MDSKTLNEFAVHYTAAWCSRRAARVSSFFEAQGSLKINAGIPAVGRAAIATAAQSFMTAFPDIVVKMDRLVVKETSTEYHWTLTGTNTGPGGTGRFIKIGGFEEWRFGADGLIAESLGHFDAVDYERQLNMRSVVDNWPFWARAAGRAWATYERMGRAKEGLMRRIQPGRMRIVAHAWPLWARMCACDLHFCDFLQERHVRSKSIFHFGTGGHHIVGVRNRADDMGNVILGVTVSPGELKRYVKLVVRDPILGQNYKVLFADIHDLQAASLPKFDLVTLFHLCEFGGAAESGHLLSDEGVLGLLTSKLKPGGLLALYPQSLGYKRLRPLIAAAIAAGTLEHREDYKSLEILQVRNEAS